MSIHQEGLIYTEKFSIQEIPINYLLCCNGLIDSLLMFLHTKIFIAEHCAYVIVYL